MLENLQTFPCPNCNEIINSSLNICPFCQVPVDPQIAAFAAQTQEKVNKACNDASYTKIAAVAMMVFLGVSLVPFLPGYWGFLILFFVVIFMIVRWQIRFGNLNTKDPDYFQAKRAKNIALILWIAAIPLGFIIRPLLAGILTEFLTR